MVRRTAFQCNHLVQQFVKLGQARLAHRLFHPGVMGLDGVRQLADQALDLFVSLYGAEAGNLALKFKATGGVFVGGGIAPKIIEKLKGPTFMQAFTAKGRMKALLEAMPVKVILNDKTALLGAALRAALGT